MIELDLYMVGKWLKALEKIVRGTWIGIVLSDYAFEGQERPCLTLIFYAKMTLVSAKWLSPWLYKDEHD